MDAPPLILGTHNQKKGAELNELLAPHGIEVRTLAEFDFAIEVAEDGNSFADNACKKATQYAQHLNHWVLGEDSGICVDALDGGPGIFSARFSGDDATDQSNNKHLLDALSNVPLEKRTAHYVCHVALADRNGQVMVQHEEICQGRIRFEPSGSGGFGYDPLFEVREYHRTFGELGRSVKSALSHRARAMRRIIPEIVSRLNRA